MKILVLLPRFPYPLDKGDKLRAYHQLVELSKRHDIHLFALSHEPVGQAQLEALKPYCKSIHVERLPKLTCSLNVLRAFLHGQSLQIGYWTTRRTKKAYVAFVQQVQPDIIYRQMIRTMKYSGGGAVSFKDIFVVTSRDGATGLPTATWSLKNYSVDEYKAQLADMIAGKIEISSDALEGDAIASVNFSNTTVNYVA